MLQHGLLQGLLRVVDESESDQAAVAIALGAEPFEPQRMAGGERLQRGAAVIGDLDRASRSSRPSSSSSVRPSRTAATFAVPMAVSLQGSCAAALHTRNAHSGGGRSDHKMTARSAFHDGGRLPNIATMHATSIAVIVTTGEGSMSFWKDVIALLDLLPQ